MAPSHGFIKLSTELAPISTNNTIGYNTGAYYQHGWSGGFNVASVDLIAMLISDAGLASTEPKWWNSSPLGCLLLGAQPRGGWQVLQRAVQWGDDAWAHCFGVDCKMPLVYSYFACSIRNRLEVWKSEDFLSPMLQHGLPTLVPTENVPSDKVDMARQNRSEVSPSKTEISSKDAEIDVEKKVAINTVTSSPQLYPVSSRTSRIDKNPSKPETQGDVQWNVLERGIRGTFALTRPTKLLDGARGGQAFVCDILLPQSGKAYSVEEQARMQLLSVILVVAGAAHCDDPQQFLTLLEKDFEVGTRLGSVFGRLLPCLIMANVLVLALATSVCFALWHRNIYGPNAPYVVQLCSLASWASGAIGLLMLGGNPRVRINSVKPAPKHIQDRLDLLTGDCIKVNFGSLHGSVFVDDRGSCYVPSEILHTVCRWRMQTVRSWYWHFEMVYFLLFLLLSIALQIAGSRIATIKSQVMSIVILVLTSVLRGAGLSGSEKWMIPRWKRRAGARYAVQLQGQIESRASASET